MNLYTKNIGTAVNRPPNIGGEDRKWNLSATCDIVDMPGGDIKIGGVRYLSFAVDDGLEILLFPNDSALLEQIAGIFTKAAEFVASQGE